MSPADPWRVDRLDLPAYLRRIGVDATDADRAPDGELLKRLHRQHVLAIPFENLDIVLGRGVDTDLDAVQDKLVRRRRGGYCYEHATLFAAALARHGYRIRRLLARIGHHPDDPRPRTHMALHVEARDGAWLADVGFGGALLDPLPWADDTPAEQGGWNYRLADRHGDRVLEQWHNGDWQALHTLTDHLVYPADVLEVNHFTATHASSPFVGSIVAMRREAGRRVRLHGRQLEIETPERGATRSALDAAGAVTTLTERIGIQLNDVDRDELLELLSDPTNWRPPTRSH